MFIQWLSLQIIGMPFIAECRFIRGDGRGSCLKRGAPAPGNRQQHIVSAAVTGKQRHAVLQRGKEDRSSLAAESAGKFAFADGPLELFHELANILGTARRTIFADCFDFAGSLGLRRARSCSRQAHPGDYSRGRY